MQELSPSFDKARKADRSAIMTLRLALTRYRQGGFTMRCSRRQVVKNCCVP